MRGLDSIPTPVHNETDGLLQQEPKSRPRPKALFILDPGSVDLIYAPQERCALEQLLEFIGPPLGRDDVEKNAALLAEVEVILSGWGAPVLNEAFLNAAPKLRAFFYGSGSIRNFVTEAFWARNIPITSAYAANAVPVAEYTVGSILLSLKHFWSLAAKTRRGEGWGDHTRQVPGAFRSTVGFVSCGMIVRKTLELLKPYDLQRLVFCPFLSDEEANALGAQRCTLPELFRRSDVVSIHTPDLPETRGLITGKLVSSMKPGATLINSARGAVVQQPEVIEVLKSRPDLTAVLDVCEPEPPEPDSALLTLPNVILTPHIAGSLGPECARLGEFVLEEVRRFVSGRPLKWQITREQAAKLA